MPTLNSADETWPKEVQNSCSNKFSLSRCRILEKDSKDDPVN